MADPNKRGMLEEIALQIPGFSGYLRREARRDADRTARTHLTATLRAAKERVSAAKTARAQAGDLGALTALETATDRLSRLISKVTNADTGYTGFFDSNKVDEATLESVYQLDLALLSDAKAIEDACQGPDVASLTERLERFEQEFDRRRTILKGAS